MGGTGEDLADIYGELGQKGNTQGLWVSVKGAEMPQEPQGLPITQARERERRSLQSFWACLLPKALMRAVLSTW